MKCDRDDHQARRGSLRRAVGSETFLGDRRGRRAVESRGAIVVRTYQTHKNLCIAVFLVRILGPDCYRMFPCTDGWYCQIRTSLRRQLSSDFTNVEYAFVAISSSGARRCKRSIYRPRDRRLLAKCASGPALITHTRCSTMSEAIGSCISCCLPRQMSSERRGEAFISKAGENACHV